MTDDGGTPLSESIESRLQEAHHSVFREKRLLDPETVIDEDRIVGRDTQLDNTITYLRPALEGDRPPSMLLFGPSGTGKSLIINAVCEQVIKLLANQDKRFGVISLNCQMIKSHDRAVYNLVEEAAATADVEPDVPQSGISTDQKLRRFFDIINEHFDAVVIILDEVDMLIGRKTNENEEPAFSRLLYQLSRASQIGRGDCDVSVAALTNDPRFMQELGSRTASSFNPNDIVFSDYDADQLQAILERRQDAYHEDVLTDDVIPLSAALAAQDHGDARKAIDLFRIAGVIADRRGEKEVTEAHVRAAQAEIERNRTLTQMQGLSMQKKLSLFATAAVTLYSEREISGVPTTVSYPIYEYITELVGADTKSRHSYFRYLTESETYNFVTSEKTGRGYGSGVHREFTLVDDPEVVAETLREDGPLENIDADEEMLLSVVNAQVRNFFDDS